MQHVQCRCRASIAPCLHVGRRKARSRATQYCRVHISRFGRMGAGARLQSSEYGGPMPQRTWREARVQAPGLLGGSAGARDMQSWADPGSWVLNPRSSLDVSAGYRSCCFKYMYSTVEGAHSRRPGSVPTAHAPGQGGCSSSARAMPLVFQAGRKWGLMS